MNKICKKYAKKSTEKLAKNFLRFKTWKFRKVDRIILHFIQMQYKTYNSVLLPSTGTLLILL
jgi:hypothetical protein